MLAGLLEGHQKVSIGTILQRCKALPLAPKALCLEPFCKLANVTLHFGRIVSFWQLMLQYFFDIFSIFRYFSMQNIAKSSLCNQFARSPSQVRIKAPKGAFWVQKEVFCNVVKRFQLEPFGDLLGGRLTYTYFGRFASILQHCRATCLQPFCKVAKYFLVHQLHHFWNLSATLQGRNVSFMQGFCNQKFPTGLCKMGS